MTPQLPDICRTHHGGNEQSEAANASVSRPCGSASCVCWLSAA